MFAQVRDPLAAAVICWGFVFAGWLTGTEFSVRGVAIIQTGAAAAIFAIALFTRFGWPRIQAWRNGGKGWPDHMIAAAAEPAPDRKVTIRGLGAGKGNADD